MQSELACKYMRTCRLNRLASTRNTHVHGNKSRTGSDLPGPPFSPFFLNQYRKWESLGRALQIIQVTAVHGAHGTVAAAAPGKELTYHTSGRVIGRITGTRNPSEPSPRGFNRL